MALFIAVNNLFLFLAIALNLGLAIFIWQKNPRDETIRTFSYLLGAAALWAGAIAFFINVRSLEWILLARRMTPVGSALVAGLVLYFSLIFPKPEKPLPVWAKTACLLPGFVFSLFSVFSPLMVKDVLISDPFHPFLGLPIFGPLYLVYGLYFLTYFCLGMWNLLFKYLKSQGQQKLQIFYVFFGIAIAGAGGIIASLLLPLCGVSSFFTLGPSFVIVMALSTTYALGRHKLLNVEDFLLRGVTFVSVTLLIIGTFAFLLLGMFRLLFPFYVVLANLTLGLVVYLHDPRNKINVSFSLITVAVVLWTLGVYVFWNAGDIRLVFLGGKVAFLGAALIPPLLLLFEWVFPKELKPFSPWRWGAIALPIVVFPALIFSNLILKEVVSLAGGVQRVYGPAYSLFLYYYLVYLGMFFYDLFLKERNFVGTNRIQVRYVFFGFSIAAFIALITNLVLPFFGIGAFSFIGPHATLILVFVTAYAILKHRLMSIEIIIQRSTVYAAATVIIMTLYALVVVVSEIFLRKIIGYSSLIITATAALLIAIIYQRLVQALQSFSDRLFFHGRYNYQKTLREMSQKIASVIRIEELTKLIVASFIDTMKVSEISFLLLDKDGEHFRSFPLHVPRYKRVEIDIDSPILTALVAGRDILLRDEVEGATAREAMDRLGIFVWVPIVSKDSLIGIIALGNKLSGDLFTSEDIGLLSTLANQTAVALDNARLYDEVVNARDYIEKIIQSMVDGVLTVDNKGTITTYNLAAEKITGRREKDVLGRTCEEIWGKRGVITSVVDNALNRKSYFNFEAGLASPERGMVPVSFSSTVLLDPHGRKMGALVTLRDLSEVKELEGKVRRADKLAALATMAAGMAHEIKNPLSSMKVLSQLLPKKIDDPEFRSKMEEILPREIDRIDRIVESLLGFARATSLTFEKADLNAIIEENVKYFERQATEAEIKINRHYASLPPVEIDHDQMSQVFSNLILNAIQAMHGGGELTVTTAPGKKDGDVLRTVKVSVADSGHGIPEETLKKLFDPFFTTKYGGTGLGLTITHSIVDGHKGYIDVDSRVGKGTTFTVTLPVDQGMI